MSLGKDLRSERIAPWVAGILLVVMFVRALIPAGFMPDAEAASRGGFALVICTGMGERTILVDADGLPLQESDPGNTGIPPSPLCAFAGLPLALVPLLILLLAVIWPGSPMMPRRGSLPAQPGCRHNDHPARAPPAPGPSLA
ncbi:MAG: hypothetical protein RLY86_1489 [Pseudomonadota bacterium]|jgi:hypothetical protein